MLFTTFLIIIIINRVLRREKQLFDELCDQYIYTKSSYNFSSEFIMLAECSLQSADSVCESGLRGIVYHKRVVVYIS